MIFKFEFTNLETMQIFRFFKTIDLAQIISNQLIAMVGELQKCALDYLFGQQLVHNVSETSSKINPDGDLVTMKVVGETERFFVKIKPAMFGEEGEQNDG